LLTQAFLIDTRNRLSVASALRQTGAKKIYILGRRLTTLEDATKVVDPTEGHHSIQCDVTDQDSVTKAAKLVEEETGYIDVLINNSGVNGPNNKALYGAQNLEELQNVLLNEWDKWPVTMATNATAVVGMSHGISCCSWTRAIRGEAGKVEKLQPDGARQTAQYA